MADGDCSPPDDDWLPDEGWLPDVVPDDPLPDDPLPDDPVPLPEDDCDVPELVA
ncbi:MAG: hypothetical protein ACXVHI_06360 [Frankiaceae bacterium]